LEKSNDESRKSKAALRPSPFNLRLLFQHFSISAFRWTGGLRAVAASVWIAGLEGRAAEGNRSEFQLFSFSAFQRFPRSKCKIKAHAAGTPTMNTLTRILIIAFWLTMTVLLIRNEHATGRSPLRAVSIEHVMKVLFEHAQPSDLNIHSDRVRFGQMRIEPHIDKETGERSLDFSGTLQFAFPTVVPRQRVSWDGTIQFDPALVAQRVDFGVTMHEPNDSRVAATIDLASRLAKVSLQIPGGALMEDAYTLDEAGAAKLMDQLGIDPALVRTLIVPQQSSGPPTISAQQSILRIHGEKIETYMVTVEQSGQTLLELHLSQLGQILQVRTLIGYTLAPDDMLP
jgi:hypothetical protein